MGMELEILMVLLVPEVDIMEEQQVIMQMYPKQEQVVHHLSQVIRVVML